MKKIKVIIEWASDGGIGAMTQDELFAGQGDTIEAAVDDLKSGIAFYIETAKEKGFRYNEDLASDYEIELDYDVQSMLEYAGKFMTDSGLAKLTHINAIQIGRYADGKAKPRADQKRKILEALASFSKKIAVSL